VEKTVKILIVDDMEAHRRRVERILQKEPDMELVESAKSGYEAVLYAAMHKPDIILMDIEMENKYAGITAAKQINENLPDIKIIVTTVHDDDNIVFAAFQTGIVDYVIKTTSAAEIVDAIRSAYNDLSPIRPIIAQKIRNEFKRIKNNEESLIFVLKMISELTPSELEVLKLLCNDKSRRQIADERCVEFDTVKKQISSILKKFNMENTKQIVSAVNSLKIFDTLKKL
jgi:DNA-binding NarL/FixJ family response regulator